MLFLIVVSCIWMVSVGENIGDTDDVVRWNAKVSSSEHYNITQCFNDKPIYKYRTGNNVTVDMFIESDIEVTSLKECIFASQFFRPHWTLERVNSTHQHLKILTVIDPTDRFNLDDLRCFVKLSKDNSFMDLQCHVRILNLDPTTTFTMYTVSSGYVGAKISVDLNKTSIIQEVEVQENTTLAVDCVPLGNGYKHATTEKKKYGDSQIIRRSNEVYFVDIRKSSDITEYGCSETKGNNKHEAALRLKLLQAVYSTNENNVENISTVPSTRFNKWVVVIICIASLVLGAAVIAGVRWWCIGKNPEERKPMPLPNQTRPESLASDHYEHIYDLPDKVQMKDAVLENMSTDTEENQHPCPPPVETMPSKQLCLLEADATNIPEGSLVSPSDLCLLQIDSEGYQIPVKPRLMPISSGNVS